MGTASRLNRLLCVCAAIIPATAAWPGESDGGTLELGKIVVAARKEPAPAEALPVAVTAVASDALRDADIRQVKDAASFAPNALMGEFGPRRLSNPYIRGIGAGPSNPGVTTNIDGVPQLNAGSSSVELLDVEQVEFVPGAQGALFGRNSVGGLINVASRRPSSTLSFETDGLLGGDGLGAGTFRLSGPMGRAGSGFTVAGGRSARRGYTENTVTGGDVDGRKAFFGKGQMALDLGDRLEGRLIFFGERDDDGDYALGDLAALRAASHRVARDFAGSAARTVLMPTLLLDYRGDAVEAASTTGFVRCRTDERTDLDYSPFPLMTSRNDESRRQITQEFRLASAARRDGIPDWQAGLFLFRQRENRNRTVDLLPALTSLPAAVTDGSGAEIVTTGVGVYGQVRVPAGRKTDVVAGLRCDSERAEADLAMAPAFGAPALQNAAESFGEVSPQLAVRYRFAPETMGYIGVGRGYKAGGFNAGAPAGSETYGEEDGWNCEAGIKSGMLGGRLALSAAVYAMRWDNLQLYVPNPLTPGNYYVDNVGRADGRGLEIQARCRPARRWDLVCSVGLADGDFSAGSTSQGADIGGRRLPLMPEYTGRLGVGYARPAAGRLTWLARVDVTLCGRYDYDVSNAQGQDAYTIADVRSGLRGERWFGELWVRNAFDAEYIPIALPYPGFAPSGYIGESGAPMTFGVRGGLRF